MPVRFLPFLLAACAFAQTTTAIENAHVRVLVAHQQPHSKTPLHEHKFDRVIIYLEACRESFTYPDKPPETMSFKAGEVQWSPAGGMHTAEIVSPDPVTIVEVEVKNGVKHSPLGPSDPNYLVLLDYHPVRVVRGSINPHQSTPPFKYPLNRVVVYLTGEVVWADATVRKLENPSDHPIDVMLVELK